MSIPNSVFVGYQGDPTVLWTGNNNQAAYVSIANSDVRAASDIVIAVSPDGGISWKSPHILTTTATGQSVDQPAAVLDLDSSPNHDILVWWRSTNGTTDSYIQRLYYTTDNVLHTYGTPRVIPASKLMFAPYGASLGTWRDAAGTQIWYMVYTNRIGDGCSGAPTTEDMYVAVSWSSDGGVTWTNQQVLHDPIWPDCIADGQTGSGANPTRPYLVVDRKTGKLFVSFAGSGPNGSRARIYRNTTGSWTSITWNSQGNHDQWDMELAYVAPCRTCVGYLGAAWKDTRYDSTGNRFTVMMTSVSKDDGITWSGAARVLDSTYSPWDNMIQGSMDYDGMVGNGRTGQFLAVWGGDSRFYNTTSPCWTTPSLFNHCSEIWASVIYP